jgi:outer membrane protein
LIEETGGGSGCGSSQRDTGPQADLFARFGLTNRSPQNGEIGDIYIDPRDQQVVQLGFQIPILDWGRRKSRVKTAQANQKMVQYTVDQETTTFDEEVMTQVRQFEMLKEQVKLPRLQMMSRREDMTSQKAGTALVKSPLRT